MPIEIEDLTGAESITEEDRAIAEHDQQAISMLVEVLDLLSPEERNQYVSKIYSDLLEALRNLQIVNTRAVTLQALLSTLVITTGSDNVLRVKDSDLGKCSGGLHLTRGLDGDETCTTITFKPVSSELKEALLEKRKDEEIASLVSKESPAEQVVKKKPVLS